MTGEQIGNCDEMLGITSIIAGFSVCPTDEGVVDNVVDVDAIEIGERDFLFSFCSRGDNGDLRRSFLSSRT